MIKDAIVGVKMTETMYDSLYRMAAEEDITIPAVIRKIIKKVMDVWED